jgi:ornithine decarboxylase
VLYEKADYRMPIDLQVGDKLEIRSTGAYTTTYASVAFNGFEPIKTYCV